MSLSTFSGAGFEMPPLLGHSQLVLCMRFHGSAVMVYRGVGSWMGVNCKRVVVLEVQATFLAFHPLEAIAGRASTE